MAFYQDNVAFVPSPPKLPRIASGSFNGSSNTNSTVSQWMGPLRRQLDYSINYRGQPRQEDIEELSKELIKTIIHALQSNFAKQTWLDLNSILALVQPYSFFLKSAPFFHYVERLCSYYTANAEKLYDVPIIETLKNVFPECVARCNDRGSLKWQSKIETKYKPSTSLINQKKLPTDFSFFGGTNPFAFPKRIQDPVKMLAPKRLTLSAIEKSIGNVAFEKAHAESFRRGGYSAVGTAASIDFPGMFSNVMEEDTSSVTATETPPRSPRDDEPTKGVRDEFHSITGREAVELFLNHKHLHKVKFIYLNVAKSKQFRPYDLVSVPRDHIEKEHYIFSSFGVLHVYPEGDQSETYTLAEWNKAAVNWSALRKILFFKNYLIHKMFHRWRNNVQLLKFIRARNIISSNLLHAVPDYGSALLHIFRLIHELSEVSFFPGKPEVPFHYSIGDFASESQKIKTEAKDILELFFCYLKRIVEVTKETCQERLKYYEEQARYVKPLYLKESMYLQRIKARMRRENLEKAQKMSLQLSHFITLIDQAVAVHLVELARTAVTRFVHSVICAYEEEKTEEEEENSRHHSIVTESRDEDDDIFQPLFSAKFVFNKETCFLEMQPSVAKFDEIICNSFQQIFNLVSTEAYSMHVSEKSKKSAQRPSSAPASLLSSEIDSNNSYSSSSSSECSGSNADFSAAFVSDQQEIEENINSRKLLPSPFKLKRSNLMISLTKPEIAPCPHPSSGKEKGRAATPNLVISTDKNDLLGPFVGGRKIKLVYNPLEKKKLNDRFFKDEEISTALEKRDRFIQAAIDDVIRFCKEQNEWIPEIRNFCNNWTVEDALSYRGRPPQEIEELMNQIKKWIAMVENMPQFLITRNRVLYVDGKSLRDSLVPHLNSVFDKLVTTVASEADRISIEIVNEVNDTLRILQNKDTSMTSFAAYASKVKESSKKKEEMAQKVSYTRSIYDVIKMSCRQLTAEEEKLHQKSKSSWETFLFQLKDASNFVANQRPIIKRRLDEIFHKLHAQIVAVSAKGSCHPITDPYFDSAQVIKILESCLNEFQDLRGQITEISYFHDAICHEFYNVEDLKDLEEALKYKLELWQYVNASKHAIQEWKATPFRKFEPTAALSKLDNWKLKAESLAAILGNDDVVLAVWKETVDELLKQMPFLVKLSRDAMKTRHWKEVFAGMGESYEPGLSLVVDDLLGFRLSDHAILINRVYHDASSEYTVGKLLTSIKKEWENRQFDLAKHIYPVKVAGNDQWSTSTQTKFGRRVNKFGVAFTEPQPMVQEKDSDTFVLVGVEKLTTDLTESHVTLRGMFQSRHAIEVKNEAEVWSDTLSQIGEIVNLWVACQDKWMYLNRIFNGDANLAEKFANQRSRFDSVDKRYRAFIDSMHKDAKILSVLSRRHGSKGWRELQGDILRKHLVSCIQDEDEILRNLESLLGDFRSQFPRFYFLSNDDCVRLLGISGHPRGFLPFVRKCFQGANSLKFNLPQALTSDFRFDDNDSNIKFDLDLHSARLEATHVIGDNDECLAIEPLPASNDATMWLSSLEQRINQSLVRELKDCVENRIRLGSLSIAEAFNELCEIEQRNSACNASEQYFSHWLLKFTPQTILLSDSVLWYRDMKLYLIDGKRKEVLERLKKQALHHLRQYGLALNDNMPDVDQTPARLRFQSVLSALITQTAHHKELLRSLADESVSVESFEWQKLLKHNVEIVDYTHPGYVLKENVIFSGDTGALLNQSASVGRCHVEQFDYSEEYGYEYMSSMTSNNKGLCIGTAYTPLTERCMIDMWMTLRQEQCAGLFGPNGVGKSVVLAELSRVFGKLYVNFSCAETTTIESLKRLLSGVVESGAWICFDHAQRLTTSVLSMLSHHIKEIQQAYHAVSFATDTQYTTRLTDGCNKLKRSNSVTTLHRTHTDRSSSSWRPSVCQTYLDVIQVTRFEDYDADDYLKSEHASSRPVGSIVFDNRLLRCKRGFSMFFSFTNSTGSYPDVPDSLRLIYRPTCISRPDRQKLIEVWLLSSGFFDAANLSLKLESMCELINKNSDHVTADSMKTSINVTNAKLAEIDLKTIKSIVLVAALINQRTGAQRSRAESTASTANSEISSSFSTSTKLSRRSEFALQSHQEELAIVDAILNILSLKLPNSDAVTKLKDFLRSIFPLAGRAILPGDKDTRIAVAVHQQILAEGLRHTPALVDKVCQLHAMLQLNQTVLIAGLAGSGKTTLYKLLSKALNNLCNEATLSRFMYDEDEVYVLEPHQLQNDDVASTGTSHDSNPLAGVASLSDIITKSGTRRNVDEDFCSRIELSVVYPNVYSTSELYGCYDPTKPNKQGILEKLLKSSMKIDEAEVKQEVTGNRSSFLAQAASKTSSSPAPISKSPISVKRWLVLDGEVHSSWVDNLNCLLDDHKRSLSDKLEEIKLKSDSQFIMEASDFSSASPAFASRCAIVHCNLPDQWRHIAAVWMDSAYSKFAVKQSSIETWRDLLFEIVPKALFFLSNHKSSVLREGLTSSQKEKTFACPGVHEVESFLALFSSCMSSSGLSRTKKTPLERMEALQMLEKKRINLTHLSSANTSTSTTRTASVRSRMDSVPVANFQKSMNLFGFAFVWAFGGSLLEQDMSAFDAFTRRLFAASNNDFVKFPTYETVFDYFVDEESGQFTLWEDMIDLRSRPGVAQDILPYTPVHQFEKYSYISNSLLENNKSVMLVGEQGCGKSSFVTNMIRNELELTKISISPGLKASQFQRLVESKSSPTMRQHNLGLMAHPNAVIASRPVDGHSTLLFLDDLSCACTSDPIRPGTEPRTQPLVELVRQILGIRGVYESDRLLFKTLENNVAMIATCPLPSQCGAGLNYKQQTLSPRLTRFFTVLHFLKPTRESILSIYHYSVQSWLEEFPAYALTRHYDLSQAIIAGVYDLYTTVLSHLKPTPKHPHYVFSLHDINKVIKGMFLLKPASRGRPIPLRHRGVNEKLRRPKIIGGKQKQGVVADVSCVQLSLLSRPLAPINLLLHRRNVVIEDTEGEVLPMMRTIVRLWLHECSRVFHDKLSSDDDRSWFSNVIQSTLKKHFCTGPSVRPASPSEQDRNTTIIKTPIPSAGSTIPSSFTGTESGSNIDFAQDSSGTVDNVQSEFELDTNTTHGTDYLIDDVGSSRDPTPLGGQDVDHSVAAETISSSAGKSSSESSLQLRAKHALATSATSSGSKENNEFNPLSPASTRSPQSRADDFARTSTSLSHVTDGNVRKSMTTSSGEDDLQSAVTGCTNEVESVMETEVSFNGTSATSDSETNPSTLSSKSLKDPTPIPTITAIEPSAGKTNTDAAATGKRERPSFGRSKVARPGGAKFGVTFVPGLVNQDELSGQSHGPLVPFDQVLEFNENPTSIIFCQANLCAPRLPDHSGNAYGEVKVQELTNGLYLCLDMYNSNVSSRKDRLELAFFAQALHHVTRLSRTLCMNGGHAFLMSSSPFKGRRSLIRLVAFFSSAQIFWVKGSDEETTTSTAKERLKEIIKEASYQAGVKDKKVVLLMEEEATSDPKCVDDICSLIRDGQCPSLYNYNELAEVAASVFPSPSQTLVTTSESSISLRKRSSFDVRSSDARASAQEKLDKSLELYFSRVLKNLHVIVLTSIPLLEGPDDLSPFREKKSKDLYFYKRDDLKNFYYFLRRCPDLMTRFVCVDLYREWEHSSWKVLAQNFIEDCIDLGADDMPWPENSSTLQQVQHISHLMAYIHKDASARIKASLQNGASRLVNPLQLRQMVQVFVGLAMERKYAEETIITRLKKALFKVINSDESISKYKSERELIVPLLIDAKRSEQEWKSIIEKQRLEYHQARERCIQEEENIKSLYVKVEGLQIKTQTSFKQLSPMYKEAVAAQMAVSPKHLEEIRRYTSPPETMVEVVVCLCEMFDVKPADWENGKILLSRENFYEDLIFYDKENIPESVFLKLQDRVAKPEFKPNRVNRGCVPAAKLCEWIHVVYRYAKKLRAMQPDRNALSQAEEDLLEAQAILGEKRVRCIEIKEDLDIQIVKYKNASIAAKQYEKQLKQINNQVEKASSLKETIRDHTKKWKIELEEAHSRLNSAVGDAIIVAACVTYFGQFASQQKSQALEHWLEVAKNGRVDPKRGILKLNNAQPAVAKEVKDFVEKKVVVIDESRSFMSSIDDDLSPVSSQSFNPGQFEDFVKVRSNLNPINLLFTPNELRTWEKSHLSNDSETKLNGARLYAMTVYQACSWIFLFDPDDEAAVLISASLLKMRNTLAVIEKEKSFFDPKASLSLPNSALPSEPIEELEFDDDYAGNVSANDSGDETDATGKSELEEGEEETQVQISVSMTSVTQRLITKKTRKKSPRRKKRSRKKEKNPEVDMIEDQPSIKEEVTPEEARPLYPLEQLWVCAANEDRLADVVDNAIAFGAFLLVTNVELATPYNSELLRTIHSILTYSAFAKGVHPCFRLFLSTAVSLKWAFQNPSLISVPLHHYHITDLSLTDFCMRERLEYLVLAQERPEFETQRRLLETDRLHLEDQIDHMFLDLVETVGAIQGSLMENAEINKILETCREGLILTEASLNELKGMMSNLLQKQLDFNRVKEHGLMLYKAISMTSIVNPVLYHLSASKFIEMFRKCLQMSKKMKSKSISGLYNDTMVKSRVAELNQQLTELMLRYVNQKYFQIDVAAFSTLVSLNILVMSDKMTRTNMDEFLASPDVDASDVPGSVYDSDLGSSSKPSWISESIWRRLILLEKKNPNRFRELTESISLKPNRWKEYFSLPPMLLSKTPHSKLYDLTVGEKALLWKIVKPKKFTQIAADLNASVLGGMNNGAYHFDLDALLGEIPTAVPCVFVLPSNYNDSCFLPVHHVTCEARIRGIQYVQISTLFKNKLADAMLECMQRGKWLILDDCHLIQRWPIEFVQLLTDFIISGSKSPQIRTPFLSGKEATPMPIASSENSEMDLKLPPVHPDFRLWMIMKKSKTGITFLPVILTQNAKFIALEKTTSHKDLVVKTHHTLTVASRFIRTPSTMISNHCGPSVFNRVSVPYNVQVSLSAPPRPSDHKKLIILQLSLLFSSILERSEYGKSAFSSSCSWTDGELLDALKAVFYIKGSEFLEEIFSLFLSKHVSDSRDVFIVNQLVRWCLAPADELDKSKKNIFANLVEMSLSGETIDHIFNTLLRKPDIGKLGLVPLSAVEWAGTSAFALSETLNDVRTFRSIRRGNPKRMSENFLVISAREGLLRRNLETINDMLDEIRPAKLNPGILSVVMLEFYAGEVERINTVIDVISSDVKLSLSAINSKVELTDEIHSFLECFQRDNLAQHWLDAKRNLFKYHVSLSLTQYVKHLADRVELLTKYMDYAVCAFDNAAGIESGKVPSDMRASTTIDDNFPPSNGHNVVPHNLAVFTRPDLFLSSVILAVARSQQQNPQRYHFETKILADSKALKSQHFNGAFETIYIEKLRLHQAVYDMRGKNLHHSISPNSQALPWLELKAVKKTSVWRQPKIEAPLYQCPLWINERKKPIMCAGNDVIMHVPIATEFAPEEWFMKGVSITSYLGDD